MSEKRKIFTAKSIEEAKAMAAAEYGTDESKIAFTVIEEPKKGLFGKVKGDAKIEAVYEVSKGDAAADYIKGILKNMDIDSDVTVTETEDGALIEIVGDTTGAVIGRRGETLDAIQYLASMACNRVFKAVNCVITIFAPYKSRLHNLLITRSAKWAFIHDLLQIHMGLLKH